MENYSDVNTSQSQDNTSRERIDKVYSFLMKLFFYLGILGFFPYLIINLSDVSSQSYGDLTFLVFLGISVILLLLIMDYIGMKSTIIDRISRLITLVCAIGSSITCFILFNYFQLPWEDNFAIIIDLSGIVFAGFSIMGWFFNRAEHGLTPKHRKPLYNTSFWALLICGIGLLFEFLILGAYMIYLGIIFASYPIIIIFLGHPKVYADIKPRKLVSVYNRATFYNYLIDISKAAVIIMTILILLFSGQMILFPQSTSPIEGEWLRNFAIAIIFAGMGMEIITHIQDRFYGLFVLILLYILSILQFLLMFVLDLSPWWLISPINGLIIAGIFYFIEEKIYKSPNVAAMPGSFYLLITAIISTAILMRKDPNITIIIEIAQLIISILGIVYIIGYVREAPKQKSLRISI